MCLQKMSFLCCCLAQKGYIEIHQGPNKKDFTLIKRLEYNGMNKAEKLFMDGLFSSFDRVDKIDLEDSFYKTINSIKSEVNSRENKEKLFYAIPLIMAGFCGCCRY